MKQKELFDTPWPFPLKKPTEGAIQAAERGLAHIALVKARERQRQDEDRADLLEQAKEANVGIVHIYDVDYPKGGLTVAFRKSSPYKSGTMVEVAVQVCLHEDSFSKKVGTAGALTKFFNGDTIELPLLMRSTERDLNFVVKEAFTALYEVI